MSLRLQHNENEMLGGLPTKGGGGGWREDGGALLTMLGI